MTSKQETQAKKQNDQASEEKTEVDTEVSDNTEENQDSTHSQQNGQVEFSERPSLMAEAKWYKKIWFSWVFPIIEKAGQKKLNIEDLGGMKKEDLIENKLKKVEDVYEAQTDKNVLYACLTAFKRAYAQSVCTQVLQCAVDMFQPYILKEIVTLLVSKDQDDDINYRIIKWAIFLVFTRFFKYLIDEHDFYHNLKTGCSTSWVISSMIFKKQLKLTPSTSKNYEQGQIDGVKGCAHRLTWFSWEMSNFIKTPIVLIFVLYRLTVLMGWAFLPSILMMMLCLRLDKYLDKILEPIHKARDKLNEKLGNSTTDTLNNIKALKFYSWDNHFEQEIKNKKEESMKYQMTLEMYYCCFTLMWIFLPWMMNCTAFTVFIGSGYYLDLPLAMEIMGLIDHVRHPLSQLQHLRQQVADISIAMKRVQNYLSIEEIAIDKFIEKSPASESSEYAVEINNKNFSWGLKTQDIDDIFDKIYDEMKGTTGEKKYRTEEEQKEHEEKLKKKADEKKKQNKLDNIVALKNINLKIKKGELVFIIGKVGSGKSTLLSTLIGDLLPISQKQIDSYAGNEGYKKELSQEEVEAFQSDMIVQQDDKDFESAVTVNGSVSLAQQKPWIQNKSFRDNILYNKEVDHDRYVDTIQFCELQRDLEIMKCGDLTEIGEKGINLSGGQQARLGLARAVYQDQDIYLLDDPISALDAHVRMNIMKNVLNGMLKDKTRILVTHSIDFLHMADKIVMMDKGQITAQGTYDELMENETFQKLQEINKLNKDDCQNEDNTDETKQDEQVGEINPNSESPSLKLESQQSEQNSNEDKNEDEDKKDVVYPSTLNLEEKKELFKKFGSKKNKNDGRIIKDENDEVIDVTWRDYVFVMNNFYGHWIYFVIIFLMSASSYTFVVQYNYIIGEWANSQQETQASSYWNQFYKIFLTVCGITIVNCIRQYFVKSIITNALKTVHKRILESIMKAPINKFFDVTPTGSILNRFNDDLNHFEHIVHHFTGLMYQVNHIITMIYTVCSANPYFLLLWPFSIGYCIYIYKYSIGSMKEIHRLLKVNRSKINNHYSETMNGNSTIRAFQSMGFSQNVDHKNVNQTLLANQVSFATWVWYSAQMKISSSVVMVITVIMMVQNRNATNAVILSVAFEWIMMLGDHMTGIIHNIGNLESKMVSIKRCLMLLDIPHENLDQPRHSDSEWPRKGTIEMKDFNLRYRDDTELVLKNCSFKIEGGQKIGIVGRTGAGKSTLCNAFTRIVEQESGCIEYDGVDISKINMRQVRDAITIIPQEPTMYKGTIAYNLDPTGKIPKEEILKVLKKAKLDEIILKKSKEQKEKEAEESKKKIALEDDVVIVKDITKENKVETEEELSENDALLNFEVNDNLSSGEKSLVQICRAILRKNKIVLLDEATANIDIETEQMIQKLINEEFKNCTMLTVAHRLQTIIKSDKVMVMSYGKVAEFDGPQDLLKNPNSHFTKLVNDLQQEEKQKSAEKKKEELMKSDSDSKSEDSKSKE